MFNWLVNLFKKTPEEPIPEGQMCNVDLHRDGDCGHKAKWHMYDLYWCRCCADEAFELNYKKRVSFWDCEDNYATNKT